MASRTWELWNFRDLDFIVGRVVGDIPGSIEDGVKDFGLEILDVLAALAEPHNSTSIVHVGLSVVYLSCF